MKLYRFSPIKNEQECTQALEYIHDGLRKLANLVMDKELPIYTLKLFAHYNDEYKFLIKCANNIGVKDDASSATSYYVKPDQHLIIKDELIEYLGVRIPDPYRSHVGCGDFVVKNFDDWKKKLLGKSDFIREVQHPTYEMLELFHPDIDVLGYIVKD